MSFSGYIGNREKFIRRSNNKVSRLMSFMNSEMPIDYKLKNLYGKPTQNAGRNIRKGYEGEGKDSV